ncbi:MAG: hypothetical protein HQK83_15115 [Fibrobacteria bacterium]|nr:hypothetical protein [Fibrobacteria bacterium]
MFKFVTLQIDHDKLPVWYHEQFSCKLPLPNLPKKKLSGRPIVRGILDGCEIILVVENALGERECVFSWKKWKAELLSEIYRELKAPLYTKLPFHYHRVPSFLREKVAKYFMGGSPENYTLDKFPGFPVEQGLEVMEFILDENNERRTPAFILTHDIDTYHGQNWIRATAELEKKHGCTSLWNICGNKYRIESKQLEWLKDEGFSIGLHGYNHDTKLIFLSEKEIRHRLDFCLPLIQKYKMKCFRSPSWFRSERFFLILKDYLSIDFSCLDTDILCPGGNGGCLHVRPFSMGGMRHIPSTIPFELPLYYGFALNEILEFWKPKIQWLLAIGGLVVVNTHSDPGFSGNNEMLSVYESLIRYLNEECHLKPYSKAFGE